VWLDAGLVVTILGNVAADLDTPALEAACTASRSFVEEKRGDLWVSDGADPPVLTYTPTAGVVHGAALYAYRLYHRRNNPLGILGTTDVGPAGILREDPDIARLLGIGRSRGFRFGGAYTPPAEVVL
jgi:hypothetical protein